MSDVYVRYSREPVARTFTLNVPVETIAVDLDATGRVIGVELLGAADVEVDGREVIQ